MQPTMVKHEPWFVDFDTTPGVKTDYDLTGLSLPSALHVMHRFPVEGDYDIAGLLRGARPPGSEPLQVAFWIDELREQRRKEDDSFRIGQLKQQPIHEEPGRGPDGSVGHFRITERTRFREQRLHAKINQIRRAGPLDQEENAVRG